MHTRRTNCRICGDKRLVLFLDLGLQPLANAFLKEEDLAKPEPRYPLRVFFCENCGLSQLGETVSPKTLFRNYIYFSSGMPSSVYYAGYAKEVAEIFLKSQDDLVVEIGSNDGHFLRLIKGLGARILGVDPAENIARLANEGGIETLPEFFNEVLGQRIRQEYGLAQVVIANNVVAHIDDHHDLIRGVRAFLADDGVFIFEAPYLLDMFENLAFDSIYHEHLSYLSVSPLVTLFKQFGMEIYGVKTTTVQGNYSLRVHACKKGARPVQSSVGEYLAKEKELGFDNPAPYYNLASRVAELKEEILEIIASLKRQGKRIACYGAPARGNTLLNYFGIGRDLVEYATEELPSKIGFYTPGMHIPVVEIEEARKNPPDYYLLLAWPYQKVVFEKEREFHQKGGKFILPIGNTRIV